MLIGDWGSDNKEQRMVAKAAAAIYLTACLALGIDAIQHVLPKRKKAVSAEC